LVLDPAGQAWLALVFALATVYYLFAWRISQGHSFFSFSLVILSLCSLIVLLQIFSIAVLVFVISVMVAVFIIQGGQPTSVRGAQRYLVVALLALPFLLAATWLMDQALLNPEFSELARRSLLPAALGFGLLLAVFPFGTWMPAMAADAPPVVTAFIFTIGQSMALFLVLTFLRDTPLTLTDAATRGAIQVAGLVTAAAGGIMAAVQRDFGRLLGYAALANVGYVILALGVGGGQGATLALLHGLAHSLAISLMATALAIVRHRAMTDSFAGLRGVARRLPIASVGMILGGLALAGFPFTAGFPTHWAVSRAAWNRAWVDSPFSQEAVPAAGAASIQEWVWVLTAVALVASSAGIVIGLLRGLSAILGSSDRQDVSRQPAIASLIVLLLAVLVIGLGLYPHLFLELAGNAAEVFPLF
jgi:formate hydrogenlyase subunit 3/multisubunit Na+/H+ antiporter MnhD subunit